MQVFIRVFLNEEETLEMAASVITDAEAKTAKNFFPNFRFACLIETDGKGTDEHQIAKALGQLLVDNKVVEIVKTKKVEVKKPEITGMEAKPEEPEEE